MTAVPSRFLALAALAGVLAVAGAAPAAAPAPEPGAEAVADPPGEAIGDPQKDLEALLGALEADGRGPVGQAALVAARGLWNQATDRDALTARLEAVLARGVPQADTEEALRRTLADRHHEAGDEAKRAAAGGDAGYLGHFLVVGPLAGPWAAAVDQAYGPETSIDIEKELPGRRRPVRWVPYRSLGLGEIVEPFQYLRPTDGVAYALAQVRVPARVPAVLKVTCWASHKVFVNGAEAVRVDRLRETLPRTSWTPVTLAAGWNRILVKVAGSEGFALKVCDASTGRALAGLESEKGVVLHEAAAPLPPPASAAYRSNLQAVLSEEPRTPEDRVVRAILAADYGLAWRCHEDLEKAAAEAPGRPGIAMRFARFLQGFGEMPEPRWRKNRARGIYEDVLERSPGHVEAVLELARILHGEDRTEEALKGLRELAAAGDEPKDAGAAKAAAATRAAMERSRALFPGLEALLEKNPRCVEAWTTLLGFCQDRAWWKEADEAAAKVLGIAPRDPSALNHLLSVAEKFGNAAGVEDACRRMLDSHRGNSRAARRLADVLKARGDADGALALLDGILAHTPSDFDAREARARFLDSVGRRDAALEAWRELESLSPLEESYPRRIGELLRKSGDADGARKAWESSLALDPSQGTLRREVERMQGGDFDFARRWAVDGVALAKECGGQEKYPKALAVHVVDHSVLRVHEDGSRTTITHNVWKILNEQGRQKYSEITVPARPENILEVRAISPEGEVFLPIQPRGSTFTLEGLQAGWIVETRYLNDERPGERGLDTGGWYFQDPNFGADADPVVLSRWVVDLPASLDPPLLLRNYGPRPKPEVEGDRRIWVFEKRDQDRIEDEPRMPDSDEICPWARFHSPWSWEELNLEGAAFLARVHPSPILEAKAREIAGSAEDSLARARAIYAWVNREITGNAGGWGPTGVLLERSGDRFTLFAALLRSAGVPFDVVKVCTQDPGQVLWESLEPDFFDLEGLLVRGSDDATRDDDAFVFRFARHTPFGRIPHAARGRPAFVPGRGGPTLFRMPVTGESDFVSRSRVELSLGADEASTTFRLRAEEPSDGWFGYKERVKDMNEDERKKESARLAERWVKTADVKEFSFPTLEEHGAPFAIECAGAAPQALRAEGGAKVLALGIDPMDMAQQFVERPERTWPFVLRGEWGRTDEVLVDLNGKWRVRRLPRDHAASSTLGTYSLTVTEEGGRVRVVRSSRFTDARYSPDEYREFTAWCRDIDAAEEQRIVLEEVPQ
jgi:tetratricopeptide (TPR) repeat protein